MVENVLAKAPSSTSHRSAAEGHGQKGLLGMAIFKHCLVLFGELKAPFSLFSFGGLSAVLDVGNDFFALIPGLGFFAEARILTGNVTKLCIALHSNNW